MIAVPLRFSVLLALGGTAVAGSSAIATASETPRSVEQLELSVDVDAPETGTAEPARALGFQLGTSHHEIADWARLGFVDCVDARHKIDCTNVTIPAVGRDYDEMSFRFDNQGRLIAVTAIRTVDRPEIADPHLRDAHRRLGRQIGPPTERSTSQGHHQRFGRSFASYQDHRLTASVVATNFCCRGTRIVERYRSAG